MSDIHVLSLGGGVQSSTLALLAERGLVGPKPVAAVFADTGDESSATYKWLDWLTAQLSFPVIRVSEKETLSQHIYNSIDHGTRVSTPPFFTAGVDGEREGILNRQCTRDFKVVTIQRAVRVLMRQHGVKHAVQWIGISMDERVRMKPSRVQYSTHRWPLIEDLQWSRHDCLRWMAEQKYPTPPRSACVYCPHHSNKEWRRLRDEDPESWAKAVAFDARIRKGIRGVKQDCYVHRSCKPLDQVDLEEDTTQPLLWGNECEGMCGV